MNNGWWLWSTLLEDLIFYLDFLQSCVYMLPKSLNAKVSTDYHVNVENQLDMATMIRSKIFQFYFSFDSWCQTNTLEKKTFCTESVFNIRAFKVLQRSAETKIHSVHSLRNFFQFDNSLENLKRSSLKYRFCKKPFFFLNEETRYRNPLKNNQDSF